MTAPIALAAPMVDRVPRIAPSTPPMIARMMLSTSQAAKRGHIPAKNTPGAPGTSSVRRSPAGAAPQFTGAMAGAGPAGTGVGAAAGSGAGEAAAAGGVSDGGSTGS